MCPVDQTEASDFERVLRVNTIGPFMGIKACIPLLRAGWLDRQRRIYFASDGSSFCTGTERVVDGGLHAGMYVDVPGLFSTR